MERSLNSIKVKLQVRFEKALLLFEDIRRFVYGSLWWTCVKISILKSLQVFFCLVSLTTWQCKLNDSDVYLIFFFHVKINLIMTSSWQVLFVFQTCLFSSLAEQKAHHLNPATSPALLS